MGKMLDMFKLGEGRRAPLAISKPADAAPAQDCVVDWEIGTEVPFVEVGGPNKKVELSPGLTQHPPQTVPQAPHLPVEPAPIAAVPKLVKLTEAKPMTAAFEAWPTVTSTPLGISTEVIAYHQPDHAASKEYATLLDAMRGSLTAGTAGVLLLLGPKPHVGASTVLLNLAASAALKQNLRVAVVDANGTLPTLAQRLGQSASAGLAEVMAGKLALDHALIKTGIASLHVLPAGASIDKCDAMSWLVAWLRQRFDLILIDGPTMEGANVASYVPHADGIYLVLPQGETTLLNKGVTQSITRMGGRLCGLIHTHFDI